MLNRDPVNALESIFCVECMRVDGLCSFARRILSSKRKEYASWYFFILLCFFLCGRLLERRDFLIKVFFFLFSFFPLSRTEDKEEEEKQVIMNGKGEIVGKRILVVFSRRHPPH